MTATLRRLLLGLTFLGAAGNAAMAAPLPEAYDIIWDKPGRNSADSMPCGGGDIGLNVWVEGGDVMFYLQRSGSLAETNEYLKLGRVRLRLDPNPFGPQPLTFRQQLKLQQGSVEIHGRAGGPDNPAEATVRIWVEVKRPIIHVEVDSPREIHATASYENWRLTDEAIPNNERRRSFFCLNNYPGEVKLTKDRITQTGRGVLFYHRNPGTATLTEMLIRQQGLDAFKDQITDDLRDRTFGGMMTGEGFEPVGVTEGTYQTAAFKAWNLRSAKPSSRHHLRIVTHIAQTPAEETWLRTLQAAVDASGADIEAARRDTLDWWRRFWDRSWIVLQPDKPDPADPAWRIGRNYQLFRYQLGCNATGEYPSKFNGGNFTYDANLVGGSGSRCGPDWRNWGGGVFTAQNQRLLHWPMLKAGDFDAIQPQLDLYRKALPGARARVRQHFGHDGAVYSEYIGVPGVALGCGWGWDSGPRSRGTEIPFGDPRADATRGYNNLVEQGVMANGAISYHWESQLEHAWMVLEYHRFSGADISRFVPFIEHAVVFFDEHYRKRQKMRDGKELDADGKLVIFPSTSCESYRGATNPADLIAGLHACIQGILALDPVLLKLRDPEYYRGLRDRLPAFTWSEVKGDRILQPAKTWKRYQNVECPQFYPLFPFDRFDLLGKDAEHLQAFRNTWKHGAFPKNMVQSWHQDGIFFARMGLTTDAASFNTRKLDDSPRRFPTFWGPGHDWVPDHNWGGSGMIGLQEMLVHTIGNEIRLLPAWPAKWDADFKLHVPQQTTVAGKIRAGRVVDLVVTSESRRRDVVIMDPH